MKFTNLLLRLEKYEKEPGFIHTKDGAVELFCADCDFYKESDKDLECGAFKLLRLLVDKDVITLKQINDAIRE